jgi:membrane-associated phospholipid phosphatase
MLTARFIDTALYCILFEGSMKIDPKGDRSYNQGMRRKGLSLLRALGARTTLLSIGLLVLAATACFMASELIQYLYPDRPIVPDLLFDLLPNIPFLAYLTDPIMAAALGLIIYYAFNQGRRQMGFYFFTVGIMYVLRGPLMILTPMGRPTGNLDSYGIFEIFELKQHGMFPSGHVMLAAIFYFMIDGKRHSGFKWAMAMLGVAEIVTLILSRGHYSIDIVGGVMQAFIVITVMSRYKERFNIEEVKAGQRDASQVNSN